MIRAALEERLDLLCASAGELRTCLRAGAPASRVLLHGNAKTDEELGLAVDERLGAVIVDDDEELDRLAALARVAGVSQSILLRVTPDVAVATHEAIATGHAASKFGMPLAEAPAVARRAAATAGVRLLGLHAHAGSQVLDADAHVRVVRALLAVAAEADVEPAVLDVGGGFGVTYTDEPPTDLAAIAAALRAELDAAASARRSRSNPAARSWRTRVSPSTASSRRSERAATPSSRSTAGCRTTCARRCTTRTTRSPRCGPPPGRSSVSPSSGATANRATSWPTTSSSRRISCGGTSWWWRRRAPTPTRCRRAYNRFGRPAVVGVRRSAATEWIRRETSEDMDRLDVILRFSVGRRERTHRGRRRTDVTERVIRVGMLGCGTVGSAVARTLSSYGDDIAHARGLPRRGDAGRPCATRRAPGTSRCRPRHSPPTRPASSTIPTSTSCAS